MRTTTLDKFKADASASKEKKMNEKKPGLFRRAVARVKAFFAKVSAKTKKAAQAVKARLTPAYNAVRTKVVAAGNFVAKQYNRVAEYVTSSRAYEVVAAFTTKYVVPVVQALRMTARVTALFMVPVVVVAGALVAPAVTGLVLSLGVLLAALHNHVEGRSDATARTVQAIVTGIDAALRVVFEAIGIATVATTLVLGSVVVKIMMIATVAAEALLLHKATKEADAADEARIPFPKTYPNLGVRVATSEA